MARQIKGKTCVVTGGASGLGAAYAEALLQEGAKHIAIIDIAQAKGEETTQKLNKSYPGKVTFFKCDVADETGISKCFNEVVDTLKPLDVLINNAGVLNDTPEAWRKSCDLNWQGSVSFTMKAVKHMRTDEGGVGGTIVNIASTAALSPVGPFPIYCGSKAAVLHFSQSLAQKPFEETTGIRVLTLCIGPTDTTILQKLDENTYTDKVGAEVASLVASMYIQRTETAVLGFVTMLKNGTNGSVWLSTQDQPVKEITSKFLDFHKTIFM